MADRNDGSVIIDIELNYDKFQKDAEKAEKTAEATGKAIEKSVSPDTKGLDDLNKKWKAVDVSTSAVKGSIQKLKDEQIRLNQLYKSGSIGEKEYAALKKAISDTQQALKSQSSELSKANQEYEKNNQKLNELTATADKLGLEMDAIIENTRGVYREFESISGTAVFDELVEGALEGNKEFQKLNERFDAVNGKIEIYAEKAKSAGQSQEELGEKTANTIKHTENFGKEIDNASGKSAQAAKTLTTMQIAFANLVAKGVEIAIKALKDFTKQGIDYASTLQFTNAALEQTFGPEGQYMIEQWASIAMDSMGLAEGTAKEWARQLGLVFSQTESTNVEMAEMSTLVVQASRDWASFNNADPEKVFDALQDGINGNLRGLREYGIIIAESDLATSEYAESLGKAYGELTESEKILVRYNAIIDATSEATGHFAQNTDTYANQQFTLNQQLEIFSGQLAEHVLPVLTDILQETNDYLKENGEVLSNLGAVIAAILGLFLDLIKVISSLSPETLQMIALVMIALKVFSSLDSGLTKLASGALSKTTIKIIALVAAISVLLYLILALKEGSERASDAIEGMGDVAAQATNAATSNSGGGFATGTRYAPRGWYEVAEQGPEMMITKDGRAMLLTQGGEQILNATQTANMLRSGSPGFASGASSTSTIWNISVENLEKLQQLFDLVDSQKRRERATGGE